MSHLNSRAIGSVPKHRVVTRAFILIVSAYCCLIELFADNIGETKSSSDTEALISSLFEIGERSRGLKTFEVEGSTSVELSPELIEATGLKNPIKGKFHVWAKDDILKTELTRTNSDGTERLIEFFSDHENSAMISRGGIGGREATIAKRNLKSPSREHPVFSNYGFLFSEFNGADFESPPLTLLQDRNFWKEAALRIKKNTDLNGVLNIELKAGDGTFVIVQCVRQKGSKEESDFLVPSAISKFDNHGVLKSKFEVLSWLFDPVVGPVAREVQLTTDPPADPHGKLPPTWRRLTMRIDSWKANPTIDEADISFDPSSPDMIHDAENDVHIKVPR